MSRATNKKAVVEGTSNAVFYEPNFYVYIPKSLSTGEFTKTAFQVIADQVPLVEPQFDASEYVFNEKKQKDYRFRVIGLQMSDKQHMIMFKKFFLAAESDGPKPFNEIDPTAVVAFLDTVKGAIIFAVPSAMIKINPSTSKLGFDPNAFKKWDTTKHPSLFTVLTPQQSLQFMSRREEVWTLLGQERPIVRDHLFRPIISAFREGNENNLVYIGNGHPFPLLPSWFKYDNVAFTGMKPTRPKPKAGAKKADQLNDDDVDNEDDLDNKKESLEKDGIFSKSTIKPIKGGVVKPPSTKAPPSMPDLTPAKKPTPAPAPATRRGAKSLSNTYEDIVVEPPEEVPPPPPKKKAPAKKPSLPLPPPPSPPKIPDDPPPPPSLPKTQVATSGKKRAAVSEYDDTDEPSSKKFDLTSTAHAGVTINIDDYFDIEKMLGYMSNALHQHAPEIAEESKAAFADKPKPNIRRAPTANVSKARAATLPSTVTDQDCFPLWFYAINFIANREKPEVQAVIADTKANISNPTKPLPQKLFAPYPVNEYPWECQGDETPQHYMISLYSSVQTVAQTVQMIEPYLEDEKKLVKKDIDDLQQRYIDLKTSLEKEKSVSDNLRSNVSTLEQRLKDTEDDLSGSNKELVATQEHSTKLEEELTKLKEELAAAQAEKEELLAEIQAFREAQAAAEAAAEEDIDENDDSFLGL